MTDSPAATEPRGPSGAATPVIDTHVHALPVALLGDLVDREIDGVRAEVVDGGWSVRLPGEPESKLVRPPMADVERRATWAHRHGITGQVVSPWLDAQPTAEMPERSARDWAARLNAALSEQDGPGSVLATVAVTPHIADDLTAAIERDAMAGALLSTNPAGAEDLTDPALEPFWEAAAGLGVPVVLHPPTSGPSRLLPRSAEFGNTFCRIVDSTFAVTSLLLSGVLDRHPRLRLVVVHGGGFLPYQAMRLDGGHRADRLASYRLGRGTPSDYLAELHYDTVAMNPAAIRFLVDSVGADRVVLGSDYPFPLGDATPVQTVRAARLGDAATADVLGGNAARLFPAATA